MSAQQESSPQAAPQQSPPQRPAQEASQRPAPSPPVPQPASQQSPSPGDAPPDREMFRSPGSVVLWWAWLAVTVIALGDLAVQGRGRLSAIVAALIVTITGVLYACALRPRIVADKDAVTVVNPLRQHRVPWGAVTSVDLSGSVGVHCAPTPGAAKGKVIHSWAVQAAPRAAMRRDFATRRAERQMQRRPGRAWSGSPAVEPPGAGNGRMSAESVTGELTAWLAGRRAAAAPAGPVTARWEWASIAAMAVPLLLLAVAVLA